MTDGFGNRPYLWRSMTFYPISYRQSSCLKKNGGYTTFVVHSNTMNDKDFAHYEKLFAEYKDRTDFLCGIDDSWSKEARSVWEGSRVCNGANKIYTDKRQKNLQGHKEVKQFLGF